jgi:hypothetical protein
MIRIPHISENSYHLHVRLVKCIVLRDLRLFQKLFRTESDPKMRFGCTAHNLMPYSVLGDLTTNSLDKLQIHMAGFRQIIRTDR